MPVKRPSGPRFRDRDVVAQWTPSQCIVDALESIIQTSFAEAAETLRRSAEKSLVALTLGTIPPTRRPHGSAVGVAVAVTEPPVKVPPDLPGPADEFPPASFTRT